MSRAERRDARRREDASYANWTGGYRPYDLVKEASIAFGVILALAVVLTILFSSPDEKPTTIRSWSHTDPVDFVTTAVSELDGSGGTAGYGPPYNHASDGQHIGPIRLQKWFGVSHPVDTVQDFVIAPLRSIPDQPALQSQISAYQAAPTKQQTAWTNAYTNALTKSKVASNGGVSLPTGHYGPVAPMMSALLSLAQSGGLDGALLTSKQFYQTDYTKPLLYIADGGLLGNRADAEHLSGDQWGMMNETGSYPGQVWLWLYTFWYQIKPFTTSWADNADIAVMAVMGVLSLLFVCIPLLPVINRIPRWIPIYKLIWRQHYRSASG